MGSLNQAVSVDAPDTRARPEPPPPAEQPRPVRRQAPASAAPSPPPSAVVPPVKGTLCTCGHPEEAHEHWRRGRDCGICGAAVCGRFRAAR